MRIKALPVSLAFLGFILSSAPSFAITGTIEVEVPFEFHVGKSVLPPATYVIDVASGSEPNVLSIKAKKNGTRVMFDSNQMPEKADPRTIELVFDKVGDAYYLMEVWGLVDTGRAIKQGAEGAPPERGSEADRKHIVAKRVVD